MSYYCYFNQLLNSNACLLPVHPSFRTKPVIENVIPEASPELSEEDVCFVKLTTTLRLLLFTSSFSLVPMTNLLFLKKILLQKAELAKEVAALEAEEKKIIKEDPRENVNVIFIGHVGISSFPFSFLSFNNVISFYYF